MSTRLKVGTAAGILLATFILVEGLRPTQEPRYHGFTLAQCLTNRSHEAYEALIVLGTNNLPLLLERLAYDPDKDIRWRGFYEIYRLTHLQWALRIESRRDRKAGEAYEVLQRLGVKAATAIPALAEIAHHGSHVSAERAMNVLIDLGDEGIAVVASSTTNRSCQARDRAIDLLGEEPQSSIVRAALTNALNDPDPKIQAMARGALTNAALLQLDQIKR